MVVAVSLLRPVRLAQPHRSLPDREVPAPAALVPVQLAFADAERLALAAFWPGIAA